ncbi:efflux RND transporter permease subunit [Neochlamydia sp. TUME1]|uniref:efflux RND transporter permease subunit n=1 Tax=Neochlamydia sp. TUME1 TaxID=1478174 RepID=UPI000AECC862|nr:efflux RND transporter permease subunit [Neochlamydia sp. TUME1]
MILSDLSIKRPTFISMITFGLAIFGLLAYKELGVDLYPKIDFPIITIISSLPGADPESIEKTVTEVIEEAVATLNSIKHLRSTSAEGISQVVVEFDLEKNIDIAYQEIQAKLGTIRKELPSDLQEIVIGKFDIDSAPIMALLISGDLPIQQLSYLADKSIKDKLQQVSGVGQIKLIGKQERTIWISLDPFKMEGFSVTVQDISTALKAQHIELPGGRISSSTHELAVKTKAEWEEIKNLKDIVVAYRHGYPVTLTDIGHIEDGWEEPRTLARLNHQQAIALLITRQSGTNTVNVAQALKKTIGEIQQELRPQGINIEIAQDLSLFIEHSMKDINFHLMFGGLLAVIIVFLFLGDLKITMISALAIPISVISTFILLRIVGFTLNNMTMLALSLSIGILIDDAIVVVENIYRHLKKGKSAKEAAAIGTQEIGLAAFAITMSIVAVFLPVAFMKGIIGRFFYQFGITVTFAVLISLFVAFTLTPMLASRFLTLHMSTGKLALSMERILDSLDRVYTKLLSKALNYSKTTLLLAISLLIGTLFLGKYIRSEFIPLEDRSEFFIKVKVPLGSSLVVTDEAIRKILQDISPQPWVKYTFTTIGSDSFNRVNEGTVYVKMTDKESRSLSQAEAMKFAREKLSSLPHLITSIEPVPAIGGGGRRNAAIQLDIKGASLEKIDQIANQIKNHLEKTSGYVDVDTSYEKGKPEIEISIKRDEATALGVLPIFIAQEIKALVGGLEVSKFRSNGERYNISLRLSEEFRNKPQDIFQLSVKNNKGNLIKLGNLVNIKEKQGPVQIDRYNRARFISVFSNLQEGKKVLGDAINEINSFISQIKMPLGYRTSFSGAAESMKESFQHLIFALLLAVVIIYMVLASQFESFVQPLVIMLSLPFSIIGALGILIITDMTLSIFTIIGIIMLLGLVTKNAILLVDYINTLRTQEGMDRKEAIMLAGPTRLRPILMTTLAMIFGMLPIALGHGPGSESQAPMAMAIIGGLSTSMLLTLIIVPIAYLIAEELPGKTSQLFKKLCKLKARLTKSS